MMADLRGLDDARGVFEHFCADKVLIADMAVVWGLGQWFGLNEFKSFFGEHLNQLREVLYK